MLVDTCAFRFPARSGLIPSWGSWGSLGRSWGAVWHSWSSLGALMGVLEAFLVAPVLSGASFGQIWIDFEWFWEGFGRIWGWFLDVFSMIFWIIFENSDFVKIMVSPR